jgi:hypothetical protein
MTSQEWPKQQQAKPEERSLVDILCEVDYNYSQFQVATANAGLRKTTDRLSFEDPVLDSVTLKIA